MVGLCTLWILFGRTLPLRGQQPAKPTEQLVQELFTKAQPHLEAALGTRLDKLPQFRVVTPDQLRREPDATLDTLLRLQFPHLRGDVLQKSLEVGRMVRVNATVARHAQGNDVIHVVPENLSSISRWDAGLATVNSQEFLQLALVHEAVLQRLDQRHDLGRRRQSCMDDDELRALEAAILGRAQDVTRAVARRLGTEAFFPLLAKRYLHVPDVAPDASLRLVSQSVVRERHWASVHGLAFWDYLADHRVADAEKQVFGRPPRQVRWITRPGLYVNALKSNRPDLADVMTRLKSAVPQAEWVGATQPWTPAMVSQVAALLNEKTRAEKVLAAWDEGRTLVWTHKTNLGAQVGLSVVRYETAAGARAYFGFAVDLQRKRDETPGACGPALKVLEAKSSALTLAGLDETIRTDKRIQFGAGSQAVPVSMVLARSGDLVIECSWHGFSADTDWAERIINATLKVAK